MEILRERELRWVLKFLIKIENLVFLENFSWVTKSGDLLLGLQYKEYGLLEFNITYIFRELYNS